MTTSCSSPPAAKMTVKFIANFAKWIYLQIRLLYTTHITLMQSPNFFVSTLLQPQTIESVKTLCPKHLVSLLAFDWNFGQNFPEKTYFGLSNQIGKNSAPSLPPFVEILINCSALLIFTRVVERFIPIITDFQTLVCLLFWRNFSLPEHFSNDSRNLS